MVHVEVESDKKLKRIEFKLSYIYFVLLILGCTTGYVHSGSVGASAGAAVSLLIALSTFVGLVPFIGTILYWMLASKLKEWLAIYVEPMGIMGFKIVFIVGLAISIVLTVIASILAIVFILDR